MVARIITPPVAMAVSLAEARNAARINGTDSDADIEIQVRSITAEAEHFTGRAIINRTCRVTLDAFPILKGDRPAPLPLDLTPIGAVLALKYFDAFGIEQTLDPADYIVDGVSEPGRIELEAGLTWPATQARINAVNVDVICGYGADDTTTPDAFKGYILAKVWEQFAPGGTPIAPNLCDRLQSLKVYG